MELSNDNMYHKLAKTPLAQQYTMCRLQPGTMAIILGILSILIDPLPSFVLVSYLYKNPLDNEDDVPPFFDGKIRKERQLQQRRVVMASLIFTSIHLIGILGLIVAGCINNTRYFQCWFCTMPFNCFMSKLIASVTLLTVGFQYASLFVFLSICDIPLAVATVYCYGQLATVERNKRYLSMTSATYMVYSQPPPDYSQQLYQV